MINTKDHMINNTITLDVNENELIKLLPKLKKLSKKGIIIKIENNKLKEISYIIKAFNIYDTRKNMNIYMMLYVII